MSKKQAHQVLDGVLSGKYVSQRRIREALMVTGDLEPSSPRILSARRMPNFGRTR